MEQAIEKSIADGEVAGCVLHAINRDGSFKYAKAFGKSTLQPGTDKPLQLDTIMWVASCTKLMTSISALQLVERGQVTLDEPVYKYIPELKDFPVLKGFKEDGEPIEEPHRNPITLRLLLTHSSGITYESMHPKLMAWAKYKGRQTNMSTKLLKRFDAPLLFEPGTSWMYGPGIDYAGLFIERVTNMSLEEYMQKNLWQPLGMNDTTFYISKRPDLKARMADMTWRDAESGKISVMKEPIPWKDDQGKEPEDCLGGQGSFTCGSDYIKLLHALLTTDTNEKILKKDTVELFFTPQLNEASAGMLNAVLKDETANNAMGGAPQDVKKDWGLGGLLICEDSPDGKREGTMIWGGLPNLIWFCDRKAGLTGVYASQLLPTGDAKTAALDRQFEAAMYEQYAEAKSVSARL